ncbi:restriction endonuclease subunit S [Methylicorpusculum sp.]|uniref:restriction endonuclease subunit S n=1 Tax=Methylicorpusculum sp. TaxID=2713644 RepID=UPI0027246444|nr:restriction endonuclease subunit S [Methylicorpusculum sp.]MDO8842868.1 restriction endonuclease subunit S [Methylicorpusculum sp.]
MNPDQLLQHFDRISEAPDAIPRLRRFILDLAVRGKLVEQDPDDEPAGELLARIQVEKERLLKEGNNKESKTLAPITTNMPYELPATWKWVPLGVSVNNHVGGGTPSKNNSTYWGGDIYWASVKDIGKDKYVDSTIDRITEAGLADSSSNLIPAGNLIVVTRMGLGKVSINRVAIAINQDLRALSLSSLSEIDYFYNFLKTYGFKGSGLTVKGIKVEELLNIPFPLAPLAEQHRIVAKVDELMALCDRLQAAQTEREQSRDRLVAASLNRLNQSDQSRRPGRDCRDPDFMDESGLGSFLPDTNPKQQNVSSMEGKQAYIPVNWIPAIPAGTTGFDDVRFVLENLPRLTTRPAHIKQLRQTILNLAVRGKLVPQNTNDEPAAELLKRIQTEKNRLFKDGKIPKPKISAYISDVEQPFSIPIGWTWARVWDVAQLITSGSRDWAKYYSTKGAVFVTMGNLSRGHYNLRTDSFRYVNPPKDGEGSRTKLEVNDLLISITGDVGNLGLIPSDFGDAYINQHTCLLRFMPEVQNRYFPELMRSPWAKLQFDAPQRGIKNSFRLGDVGEMLIPLPPLPEQHRIVAKVDELMALCDQLEAQLTRTAADSRRLLESLLHEALVPASKQAA